MLNSEVVRMSAADLADDQFDLECDQANGESQYIEVLLMGDLFDR